jgi:penicillin-binding protein 1C
VEGVEAASWAYFGHSARHLDAAEMATLLAVPQAPTRRYPNANNAERLRAARDEIAGFLSEEQVLPLGAEGAAWTQAEALAWVRGRPVPVGLAPFPREVPEVATWLRSQHPGQERIVTTLDRGTQQVVEGHLRERKDDLHNKGIHHGASVLVDHRSGEVLALVGSLDPWGDGPGDQLPMFAVPRSPGSALKPFIYARAIDRGLALPEHRVQDVPASYNGYAPKNYDGGYDGLVRLEDALSRSLNLPFVFLLGEVGIEDFLGLLRQAGAESLRADPGWYGLSVAAGGVELTPLEVTGLYTSLAAGDGGYRPLRMVDPGGKPAPEVAVFSDGAAWLTRRALQIKDRPDFPGRSTMGAVPVGIHWKTGTSFGHRDAWACGSGPYHTACVWLGNADMSPSRYLVGSEAAGAPLFDILESVGPRGAVRWDDPVPDSLTRVEVDAWSGYLPTPATPSTRGVWALRDRVPTRVDPFHVRVEVDRETGEAVTPGCRGNRATETRTFVMFPTSVRRWMSDQQRHLPEVPAFAPGCAPPGRGAPPRILSPVHGETRRLIPGLSADAQEVPLEADSAWSGSLSWFVDGAWLGDAPAERRMWWTPTPGRHEVVVRDGAGRSATSVLHVEVGIPGLAQR